MNKKLLIGLIIVAFAAIVGGLWYYYAQASADTFTENNCAGKKGAAWQNCVQNMASWEKFIETHSNKQFTQVIKFLDSQSGQDNPTPAPTILPVTPTPTQTLPPVSTKGAALFTILDGANNPVVSAAVTTTSYIPCSYTYNSANSSVAQTATSSVKIVSSLKTDTNGQIKVSDEDMISQAKKLCPAKIWLNLNQQATLSPDAAGNPISQKNWRIEFTKIVSSSGTQITLAANAKIKTEPMFVVIQAMMVSHGSDAGSGSRDVQNLFTYNPGAAATLTVNAQ